MRTTLIVAAVLAVLLVAWILGGRYLTLFVDALATTGETVPVTGPFVASASALDIGDKPLDFYNPARAPGEIRIEIDPAGRVSLHAGADSFALGMRTGPADPSGLPYDVPFAPDAGDAVTLRSAHSVLPWPTPLELNLMTGNSPSWKRNTYYTLAWRKRDGASLEMTWRYEQWLYDDWGSPMITREGTTGLIGVRISGR